MTATRRAPLVAGGAATLVLVLLAPRYGWHRDELYFLQCGRRLAWGFVDQPPLTPALVRLGDELFGPSLVAIRSIAALAVGCTVLLSAAVARELGGGHRASAVAALVTASTPLFLGVGHLVSTATFELLLWTLVLFFLARLLRSGDPRWWLGVGGAGGVAFLNKHAVVFLAVAVGTGMLLSPARRLLMNWWALAGAAVAVALAAPNVAWHASHGWPVIEMLASLSAESTVEDQVLFVPAQLVQTGPAVVVWGAGLVALLRRREFTTIRPLAVAYVVLVAVFVVSGGKPYYLAGMYPALIAAGAVALATRWRWPGFAVIGVTGVLASAAIALPVVPAASQRWLPEDLQYEVGAQLGWRALAMRVALEVERLPVQDRRSVAIYAQNYGEAGAIDLYGAELGLPRPASPHNHYWWWGPPAESRVALVVGVPNERVDQLAFERCRRVHEFAAPLGVLSEETGTSLLVCRQHNRRWSALWDDLRLYAA